MLLTDWVIAETGNSLARFPVRRGFAAAVKRLQSNPDCRIISVGSALMQRALDLYDKPPDKRWGLVDCASFLVMSEEQATEAFTTDHHFE
jgi:predicted nucleic acid-binding protein